MVSRFLGGPHDPAQFVDVTTDGSAEQLADDLKVGRRIGKVFAYASGVSRLVHLISKSQSVRSKRPDVILVHCASNMLAGLPPDTPDHEVEVIAGGCAVLAEAFYPTPVVFLSTIPRAGACTSPRSSLPGTQPFIMTSSED